MRMRSGRFWIMAVMLIFTVIPASCGRKPSRVVIGIALTATNHAAVRLAVSEINQAGGIRGVPLETAGLEWRVTDRFEAGDILKWAQKFADTKDLVAVIGHSDSSSTLSAAAFYNQNQIPQIVTIATNPAITNIGQWTYRLCLSDDAQGPALADYAVNVWGKKTMAMFYVNDEYGRGLAERFETRVKQLGGKIVANIMHRNVLEPGDQELINSALDELKKTKEPDLIVMFQRLSAAQWTIEEIKRHGLHSSLLGGDSLSAPQFARSSADVNEGLRVSQFFWPSEQDKRAQEFMRKMTDIQDAPPDYGQAFAYDAIYLVRDAVLHGGFSRAGVKHYLDELIATKETVQGVAGSFVLAPSHDAERELNIVEVHNGAQRFLNRLSVTAK